MSLMSLWKRTGIHPDPSKHTSGLECTVINKVDFVHIPMNMQIGPGAKVCVKKGDEVQVGTVIGEPIADMSVPIHSSVSGKVESVKKKVSSDGRVTEIVEIKNDKRMRVDDSIKPPVVESKEDLIEAVRNAGLVGLGGAGFPTHFKLNPPPDKKIDNLLINGMECEPYITSDDWLMVHHADSIVNGILTVLKYCDIPKAVLCIEDNTPLGRESLKVALAKAGKEAKHIELKEMSAKYPMGAEKFLIEKALERIVPSGGLPHDVGVLVMNIGTVRYVDYYLETGMPLTRKVVTIDGSAVKIPGNYDVPIGSIISELINMTGGFTAVPNKIIMGGPMMGIAVDDPDSPILKNNNAILCFAANDAYIPEESVCIRCGRCVDACPMGLMPTNLDKAARKKNVDKLQALSVFDCIECGCCTYVCPAKRYLVQNIKLGKQIVRSATRK